MPKRPANDNKSNHPFGPVLFVLILLVSGWVLLVQIIAKVLAVLFR